MKHLSFLILCIASAGFAQLGRIEGRLQVPSWEDPAHISATTYAVLKSGPAAYATRVGADLRFSIGDLPEGKYTLTFRPAPFPGRKEYTVQLRPAETKEVLLPYSTTCPYAPAGKKPRCPECHRKNKGIPIRYGFTYRFVKEGEEEKRREEKYKDGGIMTTSCDPYWFCERDNKNL